MTGSLESRKYRLAKELLSSQIETWFNGENLCESRYAILGKVESDSRTAAILQKGGHLQICRFSNKPNMKVAIIDDSGKAIESLLDYADEYGGVLSDDDILHVNLMKNSSIEGSSLVAVNNLRQIVVSLASIIFNSHLPVKNHVERFCEVTAKTVIDRCIEKRAQLENDIFEGLGRAGIKEIPLEEFTRNIQNGKTPKEMGMSETFQRKFSKLYVEQAIKSGAVSEESEIDDLHPDVKQVLAYNSYLQAADASLLENIADELSDTVLLQRMAESYVASAEKVLAEIGQSSGRFR